SKRPLPQEMFAYAAKDAGYLLPLAQNLQTELEKKGRLAWVHEECEYLRKVRPNTVNTNPLFMNFKGAGKLDPLCLAVLENLLQFRLKIARKKDKPLFRILGSRSLLSLALKKPVNLTQLEKTAVLSPKQISMYGRELTAAIEAAIKIPSKVLPVYPRNRAPKVPLAVARRVKALKNWRDNQVKKLAIDPALICTKSLISAIAVQKPMTLADLSAIKEIKNWQKKEFGRGIIAALRQVR
ncbi:MAG: HRDC domain-containing protein, partial [Deltaproteobacteria bacterium]|nr:HRDC domain-containing protein [Deltaproteobacteria bacterium]